MAALVVSCLVALCDADGKLCYTDKCTENNWPWGWGLDNDCCGTNGNVGCSDGFQLGLDRTSNGQTNDKGGCTWSGGTCCQAPECSANWCTSPNGVGGFDCWGGSATEGCTCSQGSARVTGRTTVSSGMTYYEYTCCTSENNGPNTGDECGAFRHSPPPPPCAPASDPYCTGTGIGWCQGSDYGKVTRADGSEVGSLDECWSRCNAVLGCAATVAVDYWPAGGGPSWDQLGSGDDRGSKCWCQDGCPQLTMSGVDAGFPAELGVRSGASPGTVTGLACPSPAAETDDNTGLIIGAAAGAGGAVLILLIIVIICLSMKKRAPSPPPPPVQPMVPQQQQVVVPVQEAVLVQGAPQFDPQTGQPLQRAQKFDPNTGQPLPKFDPDTGKQNW